MNKSWLCILLASVVLFKTANAELDARAVYQQARDSVVVIMALDETAQGISLGSGFFVEDGLAVVTNFHVIQGAATIKLKTHSGEVIDVVSVLAYDSERDLAVLRPIRPGKPLPLGAHTPEIGEEILAIGNPKGLEATVSDGIISGIREEEGITFYQITAPISPGSSGGPILDSRGDVVGVATFQYTEGQNLNFAMPAEYVSELLRAKNPVALSSLPRTEKNVIGEGNEVLIKTIADPIFLFNRNYRIYVTTDMDTSFAARALKDNVERALRMNELIVAPAGESQYVLIVHPIAHETSASPREILGKAADVTVLDQRFVPVSAQSIDVADGFSFRLLDVQEYASAGSTGEVPIIWIGAVVGLRDTIRAYRIEALVETLRNIGKSNLDATALSSLDVSPNQETAVAKGGDLEFFPANGILINEMSLKNSEGQVYKRYLKARRFKSRTFDGYLHVVGLTPYKRFAKKEELESWALGYGAYVVKDNAWYVLHYSIGNERDLDQQYAQRLFSLPLTVGDEATISLFGASTVTLKVEQKGRVKTPYKSFKNCFAVSSRLYVNQKWHDADTSWWCLGAGMVKWEGAEGGTEVLTNVVIE